MKNKLFVTIPALMTVLCTPLLSTPITVDVGDNLLFGNTPNQTIQIAVEGGAAVAGLNLNVQISDGFPNVPGSTTAGPKLTGVDIIGTLTDPTIFFGNNTGQQNPNSPNDFDQIRFRTTTANSGTVSADGLLAILTIDTTGFTSGTFDLRLRDVFGSPTTFLDDGGAPLTASITDGNITLSPLPESLSGSVVGLLLLGIPAIQKLCARVRASA